MSGYVEQVSHLNLNETLTIFALASSGLIWRLDPFRMPRSFCVGQFGLLFIEFYRLITDVQRKLYSYMLHGFSLLEYALPSQLPQLDEHSVDQKYWAVCMYLILL